MMIQIPRRARIQEGDTVGAVVDLDFGGEGTVAHLCYTGNKTKSLLGEQATVLVRVGGGHHSKNVAAVARWHVW